jgi:predicted RNase H-like nuclease (RuvC/YqgF family)
MSVDELARELGVTRRCLYKWRAKLEAVQFDEEAARPNTRAEAQRREMLQLKRLFAEKTMEVDFLKGALQKVEARRQRSSGSGEKASALVQIALFFAFQLAISCGQFFKMPPKTLFLQPSFLSQRPSFRYLHQSPGFDVPP